MTVLEPLATGGTTSFGKRGAAHGESPEPCLKTGLFESLIRASAPTIVSRAEYDAKLKELMDDMESSKKEEEETNIYGVKMKKAQSGLAELRRGESNPARRRKEEREQEDVRFRNI